MTASSWGIGCLVAAAGIGALVVASRSLRRRLLPAWRGPHAVLAAAILALGLVVGVGLALGSVGLFRRELVLVALVAIAFVAHLLQPSEPAPVVGAITPTTGAGSEVALAAGAVVAVGTVGVWLSRVVAVYQRGSGDGDSLMYHLPFAARFVQTGWVTEVPHVGPDAWVAFYPANAELISAAAMLPFRHDALVPLLSLGWMGVALLAGWCIGQSFDRAPLGLIGVGMVLGLAVMPSTQAGTARVDVVVAALVLAAIALVLHEPRTRSSCAVAGLALGLAIGTKFVILSLAGMLLVSVALLLWRRHDLRHSAIWASAALAAGSPWYIRNWIVAGNPIPVMSYKFGPLGIDSLPQERLRVMEDSAVIDYLGDPGFFPHAFTPAMTALAGPAVFVVAWAVIGLAISALVLTRRPLELAHAVTVSAVVACMAYVVSPNTGVYGQGIDSPFDDILISLNARYLVPGLIVLFSMLPAAMQRFSPRLGAAVAVVGASYTSFLLIRSYDWPFDNEWPVETSDVVWAVAVVGVAALAILGIRAVRPSPLLQERSRLLQGLAASAALAGAVLGGWAVVRSQGLHRYEAVPAEYAALWRSAQVPAAQRIALVGDWVHYPYVGDDLENEVDYLGLPMSQGIYQPPRDCDELRRALRHGDYDLVAVQKQQFAVGVPPQAAWVLSLPGTHKLAENQGGVLVRLPRTIAPDAGCDAS